MPPAASPIAEIEARQDEVLRQLDELNARLEQVLAEFGGMSVKAKPSIADQFASGPVNSNDKELPRAA